MRRAQSRVWVGLGAAAVWAVVIVGIGRAPAGPPATSAESVEQLIAQLASSQSKVREAAAARLAERPDAEPALRRALRSPDAEVARLAKRVLAERRRREAPALARRALASAEAGELDLFADRLIALGERAPDECWKALHAAGRRLAAEALKASGGKVRVPMGGRDPSLPTEAQVLAFPCLWGTELDLRPQVVSKRRVLARDRLTAAHLANCVAACGGTPRIDDGFSRCILLVNGDITNSETVDTVHCLVVCDGHIRLPRGRLTEGVLVASGSVELQKCVDSMIVAGGAVKVEAGRADDCTIKERQKSLAPFVTFFDPATRGVTVEAAKGGVRVAELAPGKPFAKAGFAAGDVVAAVNGAEVATAEAFRKALRRGLAEGRFVEFRLLRGGKTREVMVGFDD